jgi:hypothetical protein
LQASARLENSARAARVRAGGYRRESIKNCGRLESPDRGYGQFATLSPMVFGTTRYAGHPCARASPTVLDALVANGDETISDINYLMRASIAYSSDSLRYEKAMLDEWFRTRFVDRQPALG